jgi:hypothetical protein
MHDMLPLAAALVPLLASAAGAITISFDYSRDLTNFFGDPARKTILNQAAATFTGFSDSLLAITPSGTNTFTAVYSDPSTGAQNTTFNLPVPANTLIIYAGARDLPGSTLGQGGPGGFSASGSSTFLNNISTRGQAGATTDPATSTDFGPWGGSIAFDTLTNWNFGAATPAAGQSDFLSVAIHELAHVLGVGTADSWEHYVSPSNTFTGPTSVSKNGNAPVPLHTDSAHFVNGKTSTLPGTATVRETALDPSITTGTRKVFTTLDYAAMSDIGWQVRYTGDLNANGGIDPDDYALLDRGRAKSLAGWANGDLNSDGAINATDYFLLDTAFKQSGGQFDPDFLALRESQFGQDYAAALIATVPEPSALSLFGAAVFVACRRVRARPS